MCTNVKKNGSTCTFLFPEGCNAASCPILNTHNSGVICKCWYPLMLSARCMWNDTHFCMWREKTVLVMLKIFGPAVRNSVCRDFRTAVVSAGREVAYCVTWCQIPAIYRRCTDGKLWREFVLRKKAERNLSLYKNTLLKRRYIIGQGEGMTLQKKLMSPLNIHRAKNSRGVQTAYIQYVCI